jgi:prepilin signal peptidase PulO-like enzyme (type II secretory pathway)
MIAALTITLTGLLFAVAGWAGTLLADLLCAGRTPQDDGPAPVVFPRWFFALAAACVGMILAARHLPGLQLGILVIAVLALAGCAAADLMCGMVPDALTLGPLALVVGLGIALHDWMPAFGAAFVFLPFAGAALFSGGRGMGWGDVKLAALGGALLGARDATLAFTLASIIAYIISRRSGRAGRPIAFGPYLAASIVTTFATIGRL